MKGKKMLVSFALITMLAILAACGSDNADEGDAEGEEFDVGFSIKTQDSPYFVTLVETIEELGEEKGWNVEVLDANSDTTKEQENMNTFISQDKDLIFVDAIEPDAIVPSVNKAAEEDIPVIALDSGVDEEADAVTTVYSDNEENGRLVGLEYGEEMEDEEIKAVLMSGAKGNIAGKERRTGLFAGIIESKTDMSEEEAWEESFDFDDRISSDGKATQEEADFTVVGQGWGNWTEEEGLTGSEDLITANEDITTVLGENDQMLFGAETALSNSGIEDDVDLVAGADGAQEAMDLIKEGEYFGTGLNSPIQVAEDGIEIGEEILVDEKDPDSYDEITLTEPAGVTEDNVDEYYDL